MTNNVAKIDDSEFEYLVDIRRTIHSHPELGFHEINTSKLIYDELAKRSINAHILENGVGVVADIVPATPPENAGILAFRGDLDALPMTEETGLDFASTVPDVCHACGHDVHTTALLGAAIKLSELNKNGELKRNVRFIWQPAEEVHPSGALAIIKQGVLNDVSEIYAMHCDPKLDVGKIGLIEGELTSATDLLEVELFSEGGHSSRPHLTGDIINAIGEVITRLPATFNKLVDPRKPANIVFGQVEAGNANNVIPNHGKISGTLRTLDIDTWNKAPKVVDEVIRCIVQPLKVKVQINHEKGVPPVVNHKLAIDKFQSSAISLFGYKSIEEVERSLGAEDFAFMIDQIPDRVGAMARLGTRTPGGKTYDIHQSNYIIDEAAIRIGAELLTAVALN